MSASLDHVEVKAPKKEEAVNKKTKRKQIAATMFLGFGACVSMLGGFFIAKTLAKKNNAEEIRKSIRLQKDAKLHEEGAALARKALARGTLYAVTGCGLFFFIVWKLLGVKDGYELREKVRKVIPPIKPKKEPQGRTEFESFTEFFEYLDEIDKQEKLAKKLQQETLKEQQKQDKGTDV